jgi:tripartite-type tricarboxylate transporter receptor subunit TctC
MVIPYPAGGASDASGRIYAEMMGKNLGQTVVVENVAGGTGLIGASKVLNAPPDGYTFFQGSGNEVFLAPMLNTAARYSPTDFRYIQPTAEATLLLLARNGIPAGSLDEFLNHAKANAGGNPLTYATVGIDSMYHLMGEALAKRLGANFLHVPYKGGAPALQDLAGGQVDFAILPYQASMEGMAQQKRLKIVTSFSKALPGPLKHLPLVTSSKLIPDFVYTINGGYFVRKDMPEPLIARLREAVIAGLGDASVRERLEAEGRLVAQPAKSQAEVDALFQQQLASYRKLVTDVGRKPLR